MANGADEQELAQVPPTHAAGPGSATGAAIEAVTKEIPQGEDRGSKIEPIGGTPQADVDRPDPTGAQTEPARFTSNGQLPHNSVPSPTGALPVGAVATSQEHAAELVNRTNEAHDAYVERRNRRQRIPAETVRRLNRSELQAIAESRGYTLPGGGQRMTRDAFLNAQDDDKFISDQSATSPNPQD